MADMDLDDLLDGPTNAPSRASRFAPKGSKFKPKPKTEPFDSQPQPLPGPVESVTAPRDGQLGVKPETEPDFVDGAVEMDVEVKPAVNNNDDDEEEDKDDLMETETELEDEVVREIEIYFNPSVDSKTRLYVMQYPLRPQWRPYDLDERCEEVRLKPGSSEVEIDLTVDVNSKNYDHNADHAVEMEKQTLTTSWEPPHTSGYAVGVLTGNKIHLSPIHAVVQLRPSMQHLDSTMGRSSGRDKVKSDEPQERKPSSTKKLSKTLDETKDNEEGWVPLKYHQGDSALRMRYLNKMMAQEDSQIDFSMSSYDYLNSLCPGSSRDSFTSKGPSIRYLLTLPLKERFRTWLVKMLEQGPPFHRFDALKHLAPDESVEEVLGVLQEFARVVQGLWVPKSSLVYGTDQGLDVIARDYALLLFSKNVTIKDSVIKKLPSKLYNAMKEVLTSLSVERPVFEDWKLKDLPDLSFVKSNPSLVAKQENEWECMEARLHEFGRINVPIMKPNKPTNNPATSRKLVNVAPRTTKGTTSRAAMPKDVQEAVTKALQKLFKINKICSFQQIIQQLRDMAVSESSRSKGFAKEAVTAASSIDTYPDELQAIINEVAVNIHGTCVPKSSPDNSQYDPFRKVVLNLLIGEGPNAKLKKASIIEAAKLELQRVPTEVEFQKVLRELCTSQNGAWSLKIAGANP